MFFNSCSFVVFFSIVVGLYFVLPEKVTRYWLLLASYFFYMNWNAKYGLLLLASTIIAYTSGLLLEKILERKVVMICSISLLLGLLFFFKYLTFILNNINAVNNHLHLGVTFNSPDIILPMGISFFVFQSVGYIIDVYRKDIEPEHNFVDFALFVSFFPQLVAGPIERSKNLLAQLKIKHQFDFERFCDGLLTMIGGYVLKMVIADRAAIFVDNIYNCYTEKSGAAILIATVLFAFQIYGDFGGYSLIAIGAARILGINLMSNFESPYASTSVNEFWRRWHVSLNKWFVDYLYIPLGGNRKGNIRKHINMVVVFLLSGLWHGASWHFVIWGGINAIYQIIGDLINKMGFKRSIVIRKNFSNDLLQSILVFCLVDFAWLFFRADNITMAYQMIKRIFFDFNIGTVLDNSLYDYGLNKENFILLVMCIIIWLFRDYLKKQGFNFKQWIDDQNVLFRINFIAFGVIFILVYGIWGNTYDAKSFIYFQF